MAVACRHGSRSALWQRVSDRKQMSSPQMTKPPDGTSKRVITRKRVIHDAHAEASTQQGRQATPLLRMETSQDSLPGKHFPGNTLQSPSSDLGLIPQFRTEIEGLLVTLQQDILQTAVQLVPESTGRIETLLKSSEEQILRCIEKFLQQIAAFPKRSRMKRIQTGSLLQQPEGTNGAAGDAGHNHKHQSKFIRTATQRQARVASKMTSLQRCVTSDVACQTELDELARTYLHSSSKPSFKHTRRMSQCILHETRAELDQNQSIIEKVARHRAFEAASCTLIFLNYAWLISSTQEQADSARESVKKGTELPTATMTGVGDFVDEFATLCFFVAAFNAELCIRWYAQGLLGFFMGSTRVWNIMDAVVVLVESVSLVLEALSLTDISSFSVVRLIRVMRVARLFKVIRIMRFFRELRLMITSIINSIRSLLWVFITMVLIVGSFSIGFTEIVLGELPTLADWQDKENAEVINKFGDIPTSFLSLFMAMTGGDDWGNFYEAFPDGWVRMRMAFLGFIVFALFALMNIVTAMFVESSMNSGKKDREHVIHEEERSREQYMISMNELFQEIDTTGSGTIDAEEFLKKMSDERVQAYFRALKLDVSAAEYLFTLLDHDGSGEVSIDEFVEGCFRLQGEAKALDMKIMSFEISSVQRHLKLLATDMKGIQEALHTLPNRRPLTE
eukprot:TRINITY_DN3952_c0_g2_i1.p1 TRINITY_DN3952_c0_g2~~TRINITY_DN3952_c0_g2_i1.p1  ORF type:complete len:676 (+),score=114.19 TRINITY_DN3952_c0_g2_i1:172-2199(+)